MTTTDDQLAEARAVIERGRRAVRRLRSPGVAARRRDGDSPPPYATIHSRLRRRGSAWGRACVDCVAKASDWSYEGGDPDEITDERGRVYSPDLAFYVPRCRPCHRAWDRRMRARRESGGTS